MSSNEQRPSVAFIFVQEKRNRHDLEMVERGHQSRLVPSFLSTSCSDVTLAIFFLLVAYLAMVDGGEKNGLGAKLANVY
jgi:hypothetical protein